MGNSESIVNDSSEEVEVWWQLPEGLQTDDQMLRPRESARASNIPEHMDYQLCVKMGDSTACKHPVLGQHTYKVTDIQSIHSQVTGDKVIGHDDSLMVAAGVAVFGVYVLLVVTIKRFRSAVQKPLLGMPAKEPLLGMPEKALMTAAPLAPPLARATAKMGATSRSQDVVSGYLRRPCISGRGGA
jgi:hypothetical protein